MNSILKKHSRLVIMGCVFVFSVFLFGLPQAMAFTTPKAAFDANKMGDMSDFDPGNPVIPTGDTIKIAIVASFSGPAAQVGEIYYACATWVAHDINKRGGILVDGKKKLVANDQGRSHVQAGPGQEDM